MNNNDKINHIQQLWEKYNKYYSIPVVQYQIVSNLNSWATIKTEELYNYSYTIYINEKLFNECPEFIQENMFHEFTHILDSKKFLHYDYDKFCKLMNIYSEVHASEVQMDCILSFQTNQITSITQDIIYRDRYSTLQNIMEQMYQKIKDNFQDSCNINKNINFKIKLLYYYIGFIISLKKHNISYKHIYDNIPESFRHLFLKITYVFTTGDYDNQLLYQLNSNLITLIQSHTFTKHNINISNYPEFKQTIPKANILPKITCPYCGSDNIIKFVTNKKPLKIKAKALLQGSKTDYYCNKCKKTF